MKKKRKLKKNVKKILLGVLAAACVALPVSIYAANSYTYSTKDTSVTDKAVSKKWVQTSENTWVMDTDGDGRNDVTLKSSINDKGQQQWDYDFAVPDDKQAYYVYEEMTNNGSLPLKDGYTASGTDKKQAIPQEPGNTTTGKYTVTNTKEHTPPLTNSSGNLKLTKKVVGTMSDPNQKFTFSIILSSTDQEKANKLKGQKIFGDVIFNDGKGEVSLGNNESVTLTDIPSGIQYSVSEKFTQAMVDAGYIGVSQTNAVGTIPVQDTIEYVCTNTSDFTPPPERKTSSFTLQKSVTGSAKPENGKIYQYDVLLENLNANTEYTYTTSQTDSKGTSAMTGRFKSDSSGSADVTVMLKDKQKAVFNKIPVGSTYQVSEDNGEYDSGSKRTDGTFIPSYTLTDANNLNSIVNPGAVGQIGQKLNTAKETLDDGENVTITYTNDYPASQSLTLKKYVSKDINGKSVTTDKNSAAYKALSKADRDMLDKEAEDEFEFTVDFSNLPQNAKITSSVGKVIPDEDGECSKTFKVKADGSEIRFTDIPAGTNYQITESPDNSHTPSYEISTVDSNGKTIKGTVNRKNGNSSSTKKETVEDNQSDIVTFINDDAPPVIIPTGVRIGITAAAIMVGIGVVAGAFLFRKEKSE